MTAKRVARLGLLTAIALSIHFLEAQLPSLVSIPGLKLGLANIVTVFTVFTFGAADGALVLFARIFLGAVFGSFGSILYSAAGGALALGATVLLRRVLTPGQLWIAGCLGAIAHSIGQMIVAVFVTQTVTVLLYLPVLVAASILTGCFTGLCAQFLVNRGKKLWKTIFK